MQTYSRERIVFWDLLRTVTAPMWGKFVWLELVHSSLVTMVAELSNAISC